MNCKIYHNHIPRTGGGYVLKSLSQSYAFDHIKKYWRDDAYFDLPNLDKILDADFTSGHFGIEPNLLYPEFETVTILRNPIKRTISHFVAMRRFYETEDIFDERVRQDIKLLFDHWLNSEYDILSKSNFQARYLTNTLSKNRSKVEVPDDYSYQNDKPILILLKEAWGIDNKEPSIHDAKKYLNECVLTGKTENIKIFTDLLFDLINNRFNIDIINPNIEEKINPRLDSVYIYESLSKQNIDLLTKLNEIDMELWQSIP